MSLARTRCFHHPLREAAARCLACRRFYCRECVTEHEGRVLCAACLAARAERTRRQRGPLGWLAAPCQLLLGVLLLWLCFFALGQALGAIPSSFHEGEVWTRPGEEG